jgi:hypothetical protein
VPDALASIDLDSLVKQATSSPDTGNLADLARQVGGVRKKETEEIEPLIKDTEKSLAEDTAATKKAKAAVEPINIQPWTQKQPEPDPLTAFGSLASVFGIMASAFTHQPFINSANAAAAAMNATRANDLSAYQDAFGAWKENTKLMLDRHTAQHEDFQDALETLKTDQAAGDAKLRMVAAKYGDQFTALSAQAGMYDKIASLQQSRDTNARELLQIYPTLVQRGELTQAGMELIDARKKLAANPNATELQQAVKDAGQKIADLQTAFETKAPASGNAMTTEQADFFAEQALAGDKSALTGPGRNQAARSKILESINRIAKERGISGQDLAALNAQYSGEVRAENTIGQRTGAIAVSSEEAKGVAALVNEAWSKLPRGDFRPFNELQSMYENQTTSPEQAAAYMADFSLMTAYARALNPTGVPRESDIEMGRKMLAGSDSFASHTATVNQMLKEIDVIQSSTGAARLQEINRIKSGGGPSATSGARGGSLPDGWSVQEK